MAWQDRLKEAAYTGPESGERITFNYEDVSRSVEKRTTAFDFPDADGTYIQELGHSGRQYPVRAFFWGDNCDLAAAAFEEILLESGTGRLEHPIYGEVDVVPFGAISRRDDLKTAANQAIVEVTLWETIGLIYPSAQADPGSAVLSAVDEFNAAMAAQLEESLDIETTSALTSFKKSYQNLLDSAKSGLQAVADVQEDVQQTFNSVYSAINTGIDTLVSAPLNLAFQTSIMLQAPARAAASISSRLNAYRSLAASIFGETDGIAAPGYDSRPSNEYHTKGLYASMYVAGAVLSTVNNQFENKTEALSAAQTVLELFEDVVPWQEANYASLGQTDTGAAYQQLQEAVALTAGYLIAISFSLKQERRIVLDRARTIIDLVAELYGSIDDQLDFFIASNQLTGSEILELPAGREIVYYV